MIDAYLIIGFLGPLFRSSQTFVSDVPAIFSISNFVARTIYTLYKINTNSLVVMLFSTLPFICILTNFTIINAIYNDLESSCTKEFDGYIYHTHKYKCALIILLFGIPSIIASWIVPIPSK